MSETVELKYEIKILSPAGDMSREVMPQQRVFCRRAACSMHTTGIGDEALPELLLLLVLVLV
jgi:hypothetical protein